VYASLSFRFKKNFLKGKGKPEVEILRELFRAEQKNILQGIGKQVSEQQKAEKNQKNFKKEDHQAEWVKIFFKIR
jgi:hypothetical protein